MKKQILFLAFLSLVFVFAGMNKSYGQVDLNYLEGAPDCIPAVSLNCAAGDNGLSPIPGKEYPYKANDLGTVTTVKDVRWFVYNATPILGGGYGPQIIVDGVLTDDFELNNGSSLFLLSADSHYNDPTAPNTDPDLDGLQINISWQSFDAEANHILLVAYVTGDECSDNIEVFRIKPAFSFTLDVASLMPSGLLNKKEVDGDGNITTWDNAERCVSPVWSATYDPASTPDGQLNMDYGENYVFFVVNAANFVHSWQPELEAEHDGGSLISEIAWAYPTDAIANTAWNTADNDGVFPVVKPTDNAEAVGANGECIVVRVLVEHGDVENADPSTVTLTVNGTMFDASADAGKEYDTVALKDLDEPTTTGAACAHDDAADTADYILIPRPKIEADTPTPFVDKP